VISTKNAPTNGNIIKAVGAGPWALVTAGQLRDLIQRKRDDRSVQSIEVGRVQYYPRHYGRILTVSYRAFGAARKF